MASVAFAVLLATSLLQPCACDIQALRAQAARKLKANASPVPRPDARELRAQVDRRLTMSAMQQPSGTCLAACPDIQALHTAIMTGILPLMGSWTSAGQGGESTPEQLEQLGCLMAGVSGITIDAYCAHRPAVQCVVDNPSACSAESAGILEYEPKLDCLCDACPSAKTALADFSASLMTVLVDAFSGISEGVAGNVANVTVDTSDGLLDGMTDAEKEMMCAMYPLVSCATSMPTQCGGDILMDGIYMPNMTADELALLEGMCPSTGGDNDCVGLEPSSTDTSNCGFISLGWLFASLLPIMAALRSESA